MQNWMTMVTAGPVFDQGRLDCRVSSAWESAKLAHHGHDLTTATNTGFTSGRSLQKGLMHEEEQKSPALHTDVSPKLKTCVVLQVKYYAHNSYVGKIIPKFMSVLVTICWRNKININYVYNYTRDLFDRHIGSEGGKSQWPSIESE